MAKPDCDDGFVMIAVELGSALAMVDLTKGERLVVWEVVAQTYGKAKSAHARISPADVASRTNTERAMISKAVTSLVNSNILTRGTEEQSYRLQKNYELWTRVDRNESPETADARLAYAREAVSRANGKTTPKRVSTDTVPTPDRVSTDTLDTAKRVSTDTVSVSLQTRQRVSTDTPLLLEELRELENTPPSPPQGVTTTTDLRSGTKTEDPVPLKTFTPPGLFAGFDVDPGQFEPVEDEFALAARFIEEQFTQKQSSFFRAMARAARQYPSDWFLKALITARAEELGVEGKRIQSFGYIVGILERWKSMRQPEPGAAWEDYDDTMTLTDPSKHRRLARNGGRTTLAGPAIPMTRPDYLDIDGCVPAPIRKKEMPA